MSGMVVLGLAGGPQSDPTLVLHPAGSDATARLAACLAAHRAHAAFLPFAPRQEMPPDVVEALMARAGGELRRQIDRLAGRAEAILRLELPDLSDNADAESTSWLRRRAAERAPEIAADLWLDRVAPWAEAHHLTGGARRRQLSLLIRHTDQDRLAGAIAAAGPLPSGARLVVTSPWPPFSFARIGGSDDPVRR